MMHASALLHQPLPMPPVAPGVRRVTASSTLVWYTSLRLRVIQQHPTEGTLHKQVNYKPKHEDTHTRGPKQVRQNPATKAHTLMATPLTVDTANALLRLPPPPRESTGEGAYLLLVSPPPPPGDPSMTGRL